jgi:hypothetical protein
LIYYPACEPGGSAQSARLSPGRRNREPYQHGLQQGRKA